MGYDRTVTNDSERPIPLSGAPFDTASGRPAPATRSPFGDRLVRFVEEAVGDDISGRIQKIQTHTNEVGHDPFGFDPVAGRYALAATALLHRRYFRTKVFGVDEVPDGRVLVVANHSGQLPIDGAMIGASLMLDRDPPRFPRSMVEKWTAELPFVSTLFPRLGQVVGTPDNARRLLRNDEALLVFPEGSRGISKPFDQRYRLVEFGLGFMRLALETRTPIVPVAVVGAEEQYPSIADIQPLAKALKIPSFPIIPQLLLGVVAPLPTRYHIYFGEALRFDGDADDDDSVIQDKVSVVKTSIESLVARGLSERESIFG